MVTLAFGLTFTGDRIRTLHIHPERRISTSPGETFEFGLTRILDGLD